MAIFACWLPYFVAGSRKELLTLVVIVVLVVAPVASRAFKLIAITVAVSGLLMLLKTGDWISPLHELILPQYMQFSIMMGLVPLDLGGTFLERAQFLIPRHCA